MAIAYAFEAKSIQGYILDGGKLRDMAGASALVDDLCSYPTDGGDRDLAGQVLDAAGLTGARFARRAGGALILVADDADEERLKHFRQLWTLAVQLRAPGLPFVDAIGRGESEAAAIQGATRALLQARGWLYSDVPAPPPLARRSARTGTAAAGVWRADGELIDAPMQAKRAAAPGDDDNSLIRKFAGPAGARWPLRMDEEETDEQRGAVFPLLPDNRYVAVVHADGNRLGEILLGLQKTLAGERGYAEAFLAFSQAVAGATQKAAAAATAVLLDRFRTTLDTDASVTVMPMRPILLGGDDLTAIVRGDLAVDFTVAFLSAFEQETGAAFDGLRGRFPAMARALPRAISAGAGIAFVKASQPFHLAHDLAASLAENAKSAAKQAVQPGVPVPFLQKVPLREVM